MPLGEANVLIVDDEPHVCEVIADALSAAGLPCRSVCDGTEAMSILDSEDFTVVIADVHLPDVGGLELLVRARELRPGVKVVLMTAVTTTRSLAEAMSLGAYDFFRKPFNIEELVHVVVEAHELSASPRDLYHRAARALEIVERTDQAILGSIAALVRTVEAKDPCTRMHSEQVRRYASALAAHLGLEESRSRSIEVAAVLHDIGKVGIPDQILTKPGPLNKAEFREIRNHPQIGAEIVRKMASFDGEARFIRHHHEAWDGSGYPDGLAGEQIPIESRIINVADAMDAMLMKRSYKGPYSIKQMVSELHQGAGTQFDPAIARCAVDWTAEHAAQLTLWCAPEPGSPSLRAG